MLQVLNIAVYMVYIGRRDQYTHPSMLSDFALVAFFPVLRYISPNMLPPTLNLPAFFEIMDADSTMLMCICILFVVKMFRKLTWLGVIYDTLSYCKFATLLLLWGYNGYFCFLYGLAFLGCWMAFPVPYDKFSNSNVTYLTSENFSEHINSKSSLSKYQLILFNSLSGTKFGSELDDIFIDLSKTYGCFNMSFYRVNVALAINQSLCSSNNIFDSRNQVPTMILFRDGKEIERSPQIPTLLLDEIKNRNRATDGNIKQNKKVDKKEESVNDDSQLSKKEKKRKEREMLKGRKFESFSWGWSNVINRFSLDDRAEVQKKEKQQ